MPPEVERVFESTLDRLLAGFVPILAVPEFKVPLTGGNRPSQNDIFVLGRCSAGPVSVMVEGKVSESYGPTIAEWRTDASKGKDERLSFLLRTLGLSDGLNSALRYWLFHHAASAIIEGEWYRALAAVMIVHSFSNKRMGWPDYDALLRPFGVEAQVGVLQRLRGTQSVPLFTAWVLVDGKFLAA